MSKEALERVMEELPNLTTSGFWQPWRYRQLTREERKAKFRELREDLLSPYYLDGFERACSWLSRQKRTKHINRRAGCTYRLKHVAEREAGYSANGSFMAAAVACGFKWKCPQDGESIWINISRDCYKSR
jgi:hypothetical protein